MSFGIDASKRCVHVQPDQGIASGFKALENDVITLAALPDIEPDWHRGIAYVGNSRGEGLMTRHGVPRHSRSRVHPVRNKAIPTREITSLS